VIGRASDAREGSAERARLALRFSMKGGGRRDFTYGALADATSRFAHAAPCGAVNAQLKTKRQQPATRLISPGEV
jgi:hypothetical protein